MKLAALLLISLALNAEELRIGVLSLFHPTKLRVTAQQRTVDLHLGSPRKTFDGPVTVEIPGAIRRLYEGRLEVSSYQGELHPVVVVDLERAAATSAFAEAPHAHPEASKVQTVLARSYYVAERRRHVEFDFCDTTHCQLYQDPPAAAADATRGLVLAYQGRRFAPLFFRGCGGTTLTAQAIGFASDPYPYFAIACETCARKPKSWSSRLPAADVRYLVENGPSERLRIELGRRFGWSALPSNSYRTTRDDDYVRFDGVGEGHGVGVCQRGVDDLARRGYDFRAILLKYLPDTTLLR